MIRCGGLPIVGLGFAAAMSYRLPGSDTYAVTPLRDRLFRTEGARR
ncbi:hypothetical protein [Nonomuraea cavernae]|nr:hypothetical protein [Nonomuraea cavernae]MCA2189460.1 hypothetical protein [Nonomuraea cavernae]